jgi:hypothetical protein
VALRTGIVALLLGVVAGAITLATPQSHARLAAYSSDSATAMLHSHDFAVLYRVSLVVAAVLFAVSALVMSITSRRTR